MACEQGLVKEIEAADSGGWRVVVSEGHAFWLGSPTVNSAGIDVVWKIDQRGRATEKKDAATSLPFIDLNPAGEFQVAVVAPGPWQVLDLRSDAPGRSFSIKQVLELRDSLRVETSKARLDLAKGNVAEFRDAPELSGAVGPVQEAVYHPSPLMKYRTPVLLVGIAIVVGALAWKIRAARR
jgi:hypothetical protein